MRPSLTQLTPILIGVLLYLNSWESPRGLALFGSVAHADLSQADHDFDVDFEADDVLALNMSADSKTKARALGFRVRDTEPLRNLKLWLSRLRAPPGMNARAAVKRLRASDPGGFYGVNESYVLAEAASSCTEGRCYGPKMVGWSHVGCPYKVRVGMIDGALNLDSPVLAGRDIRMKTFGSRSASGDDASHGTAVASLLVGGSDAAPLGLLPNAQLYAAVVFSKDISGRITTDAARIAAALDWLSGESPTVVNLSFEGPDNKILQILIARLIDQGVTIVAAAGNQGPRAPPEYPGAFQGVIAVTAVDRFKQVYPLANQGSYIALSAPGVEIWTADQKGFGVMKDGTSFAAPFVTAAAAQLKANDSKLRPADLAEILRKNALDLGAPGPDPVYGAGLLQMPACEAVPNNSAQSRGAAIRNAVATSPDIDATD